MYLAKGTQSTGIKLWYINYEIVHRISIINYILLHVIFTSIIYRYLT